MRPGRVAAILAFLLMLGCIGIAVVAVMSADRRGARVGRIVAAALDREKRDEAEIKALNDELAVVTGLLASIDAKLDQANTEITRLGGQPIQRSIGPFTPPAIGPPPAPDPPRATSTTSTSRPCVIGIAGICVIP